MKLPKLAIENYQFTLVVIVLLTLSGLLSFLTMPRSEDPQMDQPGVNVTIVYPGANPEDLEELVIEPLEDAINELEDIKKISTSANDGLMLLTVEFTSNVDPDEAFDDVLQKVNSVQADLPDGILKIDTNKWEVSGVNILQLALISDSASYRTLEFEAERLKNQLKRVAGVKESQLWAFPEQEIRISTDMEKMARMNISFKQVRNAIQSAGANIPGGNLDVGMRRFTIQTSGSFEDIQDIENTIVHTAGGKVVYLRDIATVKHDYEDQNYYARFNQKRAVFVTVKQKTGTNIFKVREGLEAKIQSFKERLPEDIGIETVFDQSQSVSKRVNGFFGNLLQGVFLVGLIVLLAMSFRASLIVMLVIPISILIGLGFVDLSGFGLQQMSIAGLVIALGLLVDNAIVVTENVSRFLKEGKSRKNAAVYGTSQIGWAVVSSTLTTVLAFVPIITMQDSSGDFIRSMPTTVIFTLFASLLVSLTLTPFLASRYLRGKNGKKSSKGQVFLKKFVESTYRRRLSAALARPKLVLTTSVIVFVGALCLFPIVGVSFFPKADKTIFLINIDTPKGTSLDKTDLITRRVESILDAEENVKRFAANIGRGNPRIYYNIIPKSEQSTHSQIFAEMNSDDLDDFQAAIVNLRKEFADIPGARIEVKEFEQGPPVEAPIAIKILGEDLDMLKIISRDVEKIVENTSGTINIYNPLRGEKTDLHVNINRVKAGMLGIPLVEIDQTVRAGISGLPVSTYRDSDGKEYDIILRLPFVRKPTVNSFDRIYLSAHSGAQVPLRQVANLEFKSTPMEISHFNLERSVTISADVERGQSMDGATNTIIEQLQQYDWPKGYRFYIGGELESREESFGGMLQAVLVAMIAIFGVLVLQFRSFKQPLIVFVAIPLAIIGSIIALLFTGNTFSFTAFVGLTSLVGIVVNNSIILVDYTNQLRQSGKEFLAALTEACETRFTPIVLTTATTIGGLLPLTLGGGSMWAPMGWTIIGGLLVSTVLTLIVVPVLYKLITRKQAA